MKRDQAQRHEQDRVDDVVLRKLAVEDAVGVQAEGLEKRLPRVEGVGRGEEDRVRIEPRAGPRSPRQQRQHEHQERNRAQRTEKRRIVRIEPAAVNREAGREDADADQRIQSQQRQHGACPGRQIAARASA